MKNNEIENKVKEINKQISELVKMKKVLLNQTIEEKIPEIELISAIEHVKYEVQMFKNIAICFKYQYIKFKYDKIFLNLLTDSFAIHTRNLIYFLTRSKEIKDDIVIKDFIDEKLTVPINDKLKNLYIKANKLCAHLTYSRNKYIDNDDKNWKVELIYNDISCVFNDFVDKFNKVHKFNQFLVLEKLPSYEELEEEIEINKLILIMNPNEDNHNIKSNLTLSSEFIEF